MKAFLLLCFLIYLATMPAPLLAQNVQPQPLYAVDLSKLISHELDINPAGTLTFLTEHTLAVSICRNLRCNLETLDLEVGSPRVIATTDKFQGYSALFRAADGRVILDSAQSGGERGAILFDSHMDAALLIRKAAGISQPHISTTGETFVKQGRNGWVAYKIGRPPERIRAGLGSVLSVSDEAVIYVDNGAAHIEGMDKETSWVVRGNAQSPSYSPLSWPRPSLAPKRFTGRNTRFQRKAYSNAGKAGRMGLQDRAVLGRRPDTVRSLHATDSLSSENRGRCDCHSHNGRGSRR